MTMTDHGLQQLREREAAGEALRFVHFWGHTPARDGSATDADASRPSRWRGENLLGFALMEVRRRLMASTT